MTKFKKLATFCVALMMTISLAAVAACGKSNDDDSISSPVESSSVISDSSSEETSSPEDSSSEDTSSSDGEWTGNY